MTEIAVGGGVLACVGLGVRAAGELGWGRLGGEGRAACKHPGVNGHKAVTELRLAVCAWLGVGLSLGP